MRSRQFKNLPITQKLILVMLMTSVTAVLVVSGVFGATEALNYRRTIVEEIATLGDVIGTNSTAALTFEDEKLANQVLGSLTADGRILAAHMFHADGRQLAQYHPGRHVLAAHVEELSSIEEHLLSVLSTQKPVEYIDGLDYIDAVRPVFFDDEFIGVLHLRASLDDLVMSLKRIGVLAAATVFLAILIAYVLSFRLQAVISRPILALSDLMKKVSRGQDYSLRATPSSNDEIGTLMRGFNDMLAQISDRDVKLAEANDQLQQAVEETLKAKEAAESASSAKSDFLARMSHEIRTPMNGVLGMTDLLLSADLNKTERKFAETIRQSGEALLALINDILDFSKIEAGKLEIEEADFDVGEVIEGIVDLLYNRAHSQGVELISAIQPELHTLVRGDSIRLRQVLMNLVGNAVKFTHKGEIVLELGEIEATDDGGVYRIAVRDTGIGIDEEHLDVIFDRFAQADVSTTREYGGTGLGLAICRQLVELMGGVIEVASIPGGGSTFSITLPLQHANTSDATGAIEYAPMPGIRVLVVDDNETNRDVLEAQLRAWDVEVQTAENAQVALQTMSREAKEGRRFDLVLLDFFMPRQDGLVLAADIRERAELGQPRLMMLSSAGSEYDEVAMREAGIDLYLSKPVRRAVLHESIIDVFDAEPAIVRAPADEDEPVVAGEGNMGLTVLLAEDIPTNMQVARHMLMALGCNVIEAENGQKALDAIEAHDVDLVLMDCQMPVMDGYTATRRQRSRESREGDKRLPVIALTANALPEDRRKCLEAGMDDFISKPFTRQTLVEALSRWGSDQAQSPAPSVKVDRKDDQSNPVLDHEQLGQIAELDPEQGGVLLGSVIDTYFDNARTLLENLEQSASTREQEGLVRAAHALKSSSASVGAVRLAELLSRIEMAARNDDIAVAVDNVRDVRDEFDVAANELVEVKREAAA